MHQFIVPWADFIRQVQRGYTRTIYEYDNDLSIRKNLEEKFEDVEVEDKEQAMSELRQWDQRFIEATRPRKKPMFDDALLDRIPLVLLDELRGDVESNNF